MKRVLSIVAVSCLVSSVIGDFVHAENRTRKNTDSLNDMSEQQQLKMQNMMDRRQKAMETESNIMKKKSQTEKNIIKNMK